MSSMQEDLNSKFKLAQLCDVTFDRFRGNSQRDALKRVVNELLTDDVNVNCKVTITTKLYGFEKHLKNCTALHFLYYAPIDIDSFTNLLERRADFTLKNGNGQTALHLVVTNSFENNQERNMPFVNAVLSSHVKFQNFTNPRDSDGVSHLHAACIANHVEAAQLFLDNEVSADEAVDFDAPQFAGYTPLHFAAAFHSFEVAQILVNRGANVNAKNAKGMSPVDLLVKFSWDNSNYFSGRTAEGIDDSTNNRLEEISNNARIIELLLKNQCHSTSGCSSLQVACMLKELTIAGQLLDNGVDIDYAVPMESSLCPGDTALHFAAFNSLQAVKMLVTRGARMDVENVNGITPLDICVNRYKIEDVCDVLSCDENWSSVCMTDGKTKLLDFVRATIDLDQFQLFLRDHRKDLGIPRDSSILSGCTMLHLAVIFSAKVIEQNYWNNTRDDSIVKECLAKDLDVDAQNSRGQTPIHLAMRLGRSNIVDLLFERLDEADDITNIVDEDDLSYVHIACTRGNESLAERLLRGSTPNVAYKGKSILANVIEMGMTPLHVAIVCESSYMVHVLLSHGADLHATDANGMAPIHWILHFPVPAAHRDMFGALFDSLLENMEDRVVEELGLSYLHVACYVDHAEAVDKLLELGANVNAAISYENFSTNRHPSRRLQRLADFSSYTPIHMAQRNQVAEVLDLLLRRGADLLAELPDRLSGEFEWWNFHHTISFDPLKIKYVTNRFTAILWERHDLQKCMEERFGLTRLHVACHMKNEEAVRSALIEGVDVNARVHVDCGIFAGCTPLHLLMIISDCGVDAFALKYEIVSIIELLLDRGVDVTITNVEKYTPIHIFFERYWYFVNADRCKDLLFNAPDCSTNPANAAGMSHFHLACKWHQVEVVEKFLQRGSVDVNRPTDCFNRFFPGYTPLHLALCTLPRLNDDWAKLLKTVDVLLKHGADVTAITAGGNTVLHEFAVMNSPGMILLDKLVRLGADIKSTNVMGHSFFEHRPFDNAVDLTSLLKKYGFPINHWNSVTGEGYIAKIFIRRNIAESEEFKNVLQSPDVRSADEMGRTVIHNSVAVSPDTVAEIENYIYAIESFARQDVDIDHQDRSGRTALHYAARMENRQGVMALLACGADINIVDENGKSAFSYVMDYSQRDVSRADYEAMLEILNLQVKKLQYLRLEVDQINKDISVSLEPMDYETLGDTLNTEGIESNILQPFVSQVERSKTLNVGLGSLTLFDFLNEAGVVRFYPYMPTSQRNLIDDFFKSIAHSEFNELMGIVKLQFNKMKKRLDLIDPASASLRNLLGFSFAGLCEEILGYLSNSDLKNIIHNFYDI